MQALRYSINVTLDGCVHHEAGVAPDEELMRFWTDELRRADALVYGRVTYEMMQSAWRRPVSGGWPFMPMARNRIRCSSSSRHGAISACCGLS